MLTKPMNEWGCVSHEALTVLRKGTPQVLNLNQGVAQSKSESLSLSIALLAIY
jgi:hypothetical protein